VVSRLDNFVKVKVDGDAFPQLCQAYGVEAYPTFVHLDAQGRMLDKRVGGMRVQEMAGALDNTLRSVSTSMAVAQAARQAETQRKAGAEAAADAPKRAEIASADLKISGEEEPAGRARTVSREAADQPSSGGSSENGSLYNMGNNQLQGSAVYAAEPANAGRRSRFGSDTATGGGLKELAEATARPGDAAAAETGSKPANPLSEEKVTAAASAGEETAKPSPESTSTKLPAVASSMKDAAPAPAVPAQPASPSPVIETRLSGISTESLPRPLLSRSASGATQAMAPAPATSSNKAVATAAEPAAIKTQRNDNGVASPALPTKSVEIASATQPKSRVSDSAEKESARESESTKNVKSSRSGGGDKAARETASENVEKTSEGATRADIERWMKDADTKLVEAHKENSPQRKREARAMYNKVVEKDPDNKFGKSDMAYVKMVSLIVDRDSDLLRRQAYTKIKEFEARFPKSDHKDYYTLIRAVLATDLGETNEAHKLLGNYAERFPDSKYVKMAHDTWKALPPVKKESSKDKASASSKSSKSSKTTKSRDS
jgi:hypothetical protein